MRRMLAWVLVTVSALTLGLASPSSAALGAAQGGPKDRVVRTTWSPGAVDPDGVLRVRGDVQLVGASWSRGHRLSAATVVQARVQRADGSWSEWTRLERGDASPDPATAEGRTTVPAAEPVWFGAGTAVEARVTGALPPGFALTTAYSAPRARDAQLTRPSAGVAGARRMAATASGVATANLPIQPVAPPYFTRADWGVDQTLEDGQCPSPSDTVKVIFVHHTAGTNGYAESDVPAVLRGVHAYHTANGWCDIAYNALIDRFGRIWEGRAGGMENPVRSGATGGFNTDSWAISLIGNYSTTALPTTAYTALRDLTAWKLLANRRNPQGTAVLTQAEGGAALGALWTDGQPVTFNVISGHRDAKSTECPGNLAYPLLATLRRDVDQRMSANPRGSLDGLTSGFNSLTVRGWTFDPETPDPIYGWVSIDGGRFGGPMFSRDARPDVSAVYPGAGDRHGFRATFSVPPGAHEVCVHGVNWGAGHDTLITCAWTLVSPDPLGHLDAVTVTRGQITARGWALDPETADPTYAWIDVSGLGMPVVAGLRRPDIALVYPGVGADHGFSLSVARPPGEYVVCAYAVNLGVGRDRPIGCQRVRV